MRMKFLMIKYKIQSLMKKKYSWIFIASLIIIFGVVIPVTIVLTIIQNYADSVHRTYNSISGADVEMGLTYHYSGVTLTLPDGFLVTGWGNSTVARNKLSQDTIAFREGGAVNAKDWTREEIDRALRVKYGDRTSGITDYRADKIDGFDAVFYKMTYRDDSQYSVCTGCQVFLPGKTVMIDYYEYSDRYTDAFERSIDSIRVGNVGFSFDGVVMTVPYGFAQVEPEGDVRASVFLNAGGGKLVMQSVFTDGAPVPVSKEEAEEGYRQLFKDAFSGFREYAEYKIGDADARRFIFDVMKDDGYTQEQVIVYLPDRAVNITFYDALSVGDPYADAVASIKIGNT